MGLDLKMIIRIFMINFFLTMVNAYSSDPWKIGIFDRINKKHIYLKHMEESVKDDILERYGLELTSSSDFDTSQYIELIPDRYEHRHMTGKILSTTDDKVNITIQNLKLTFDEKYKDRLIEDIESINDPNDLRIRRMKGENSYKYKTRGFCIIARLDFFNILKDHLVKL